MQESENILILIIGAMITVFLMVLSFIILNVRGQNKLLKQKQALQKAEIEHQDELLDAIIESQENERRRVGSDLHDDVGTALSNLRLIIDMSKPTVDAEGHKAFVTSTKNIIDKVIKDVRSISHNLSPTTLTYYGLISAIEEHCNIINQAGKVQADLFDNTQTAISRLNITAATSLYRVLEELLNNTIKHSEATETNIVFSEENDILTIEYHDNGKGMIINDNRKKGMGLQNIESRLKHINAGHTIVTSAGNGFAITIWYKIPEA